MVSIPWEYAEAGSSAGRTTGTSSCGGWETICSGLTGVSSGRNAEKGKVHTLAAGMLNLRSRGNERGREGVHPGNQGAATRGSHTGMDAGEDNRPRKAGLAFATPIVRVRRKASVMDSSQEAVFPL